MEINSNINNLGRPLSRRLSPRHINTFISKVPYSSSSVPTWTPRLKTAETRSSNLCAVQQRREDFLTSKSLYTSASILIHHRYINIRVATSAPNPLLCVFRTIPISRIVPVIADLSTKQVWMRRNWLPWKPCARFCTRELPTRLTEAMAPPILLAWSLVPKPNIDCWPCKPRPNTFPNASTFWTIHSHNMLD
jgi:hypothetical protein